ncbi:MAG: LLM class F420-dependent oxidoreductase [Chloroflexota bacterium]|nr:LLM class F420-dependent oxidoreductase [Chloroflexota bacterium]
MRFGLQLKTYAPREHGNHWDSTLAVARACEEAGLDSVWFADHFMFPDEENPDKEVPVMECFTVLGALAAATNRIRIGALVAGVPYRNPALLAKMHSTLDVISHGRTIVGLGAGWHQPEFDAYGWPFGTVKQRMEQLEDAAQIIKAMMTQRPASHTGKHYSIRDAYNDPMPIQKPHPPIMIGGGGERQTLRLVAKHADFCNVFGDPETVAHKFEVLRGHCEKVGRPYEEITRSNHVPMLIGRSEAELREKHGESLDSFSGLMGTPETIIQRLGEYAAVGSQYITLRMENADDLDPIHLFGETVLPALADA